MTEQFADPGTPGDPINWQDLSGSLLMIKPLLVEATVQTVNGPSAAVRAEVTVLDGRLSGKFYDDALIFPRAMQGQLRTKIGQLVLGRVSQGAAQPGKNAPWLLTPATPEDKQRAQDYLRQRSTPQVQSVAAPSAQAPF